MEQETRGLSGPGYAMTVVHDARTSRSRRHRFQADRSPRRFEMEAAWVIGRAAVALARSARPDVVHFHDLELIPFALMLKSQGCSVIYDVHEDVPADIYSKTWIPSLMRPIMARGAGMVERTTARRFDAIIAATPAIADRFRRYGARVSMVRNSVRLDEFIEPTRETKRRRQAVYVGLTSFDRGLVEMVEACKAIELPLVLAGSIGVAEADWLKNASADVVHRGKLSRSEIAALLNESMIGLCLLQPEPNYLYAMPTKIFEYMAAGLPIITSAMPRSRI